MALAKILDYAEYRNCIKVIEKAKIACGKSGYAVVDHFVEVHEEIMYGKGATNPYELYVLSCYAKKSIIVPFPHNAGMIRALFKQ